MTNPVHDRESLGTALLDAASKAPQNLVSSVMMTIMAEQRQAAPIVRQDRTIRRFWQPIALAAALIEKETLTGEVAEKIVREAI